MMGNGGGMFFGGGFIWLFWLIVIVVLVVVFKAVIGSDAQANDPKQDSPLEILQKRYARGEIDEDEFNKRRKELED